MNERLVHTKIKEHMKTISRTIYSAFALVVLALLALLPQGQAVVPAPDGGYPGQNTAEGTNALFSRSYLVPRTRLSALERFITLPPVTLTQRSVVMRCLRTSAALAIQQWGLSPSENVSGSFNIAVGHGALVYNQASGNTAMGFKALNSNIDGYDNTAVGFMALLSNTTDSSGSSGTYNTALGVVALENNTTGGANTAVGAEALQDDTFGDSNTATGADALWHNTTGTANVATGARALLRNTTGGLNTVTGADALSSNTTGSDNTATGYGALANNRIGVGNAATGQLALENNTTGDYNIAVGYFAGFNLTTGSNNIHIGNIGVAGEANTIRIGNVVGTLYSDGSVHPAQTRTFIAGISGQTAAGGTAVYINSNGKLGTLTSSARFKKDVKAMDKASEAVLALKPVTFRYKEEIDPGGVPQFGLVAEDVEKVNPDLVARDRDGKPYTVRYEAVNAMLLNEFLKEHRTVQELKSNAAKQEATVAQQQKQIEALTAGLQKVSAQLEASKPAPQVVNNP